jgi:predicted ATPase
LWAAQIELFSPVQLLARLQARPLDLLIQGAHDLPPRQRTLRTAIEHSYRLLNEEERTLFHRLGVFVGGFDLSTMERVLARSPNGGSSPQSLISPLAHWQKLGSD